jgi:predicted metalloprotease with PDZ domain
MREAQRKYTDLNYSLGFTLGTDGVLGDVLPDSTADRAGLMQGTKLIAVNERAWSSKILRDAVKAGVTNTAPVNLLVENSGYYKTYPLAYHGGEKYPTLVRDQAKPDLIAQIIKPLTPELSTNSLPVK